MSRDQFSRHLAINTPSFKQVHHLLRFHHEESRPSEQVGRKELAYSHCPKNTMVLKEFFDAKKEKFDDFENPDAFEKKDCLSCRVLGM